jgi:hypothetical protein
MAFAAMLGACGGGGGSAMTPPAGNADPVAAFNAPERVQYRCQLAGYDPGWTEAGTQRAVSYSKLPAGGYRFLVAAGISCKSCEFRANLIDAGRRTFSKATSLEWIAGGALIVIAGTTLLIALASPPNNWDSQTAPGQRWPMSRRECRQRRQRHHCRRQPRRRHAARRRQHPPPEQGRLRRSIKTPPCRRAPKHLETTMAPREPG